MTPTLRKRHRQLWFIWAVLLPLLMIAAWSAIPKPAYQDFLYLPAASTLP